MITVIHHKAKHKEFVFLLGLAAEFCLTALALAHADVIHAGTTAILSGHQAHLFMELRKKNFFIENV